MMTSFSDQGEPQRSKSNYYYNGFLRLTTVAANNDLPQNAFPKSNLLHWCSVTVWDNIEPSTLVGQGVTILIILHLEDFSLHKGGDVYLQFPRKEIDLPVPQLVDHGLAGQGEYTFCFEALIGF